MASGHKVAVVVLCLVAQSICADASAKTEWVVNTVSNDPDLPGCDGNGGPCSLRAAILAINAGEGDPGAEQLLIRFDPTVFGGGEPAVIALSSELPAIDADRVFISGDEAPWFLGLPSENQVVLDGSGIPGLATTGLQLNGDSGGLEGLTIRGFGFGVRVAGNGNTIGPHNLWEPGGCNDLRRNVLVDNTIGLEISGRVNRVTANWIGTADGGVTASPNTYGIFIDHPNGISMNQIGSWDCGPDTLVIAGNHSHGIFMDSTLGGDGYDGDAVYSAVVGTLTLGNGGNGIHMHNCAGCVVYEDVRVRGNAGDGIHVTGDSLPDDNLGNRLSPMNVEGNGGLGINLDGGAGEDAFGVTHPHPADGGGPNGLLPYPVITDVQGAGSGQVIVSGTACEGVTSSENCHVYFYGADGDPSGFGEATTYLGSAWVHHNQGFTFTDTISESPTGLYTATVMQDNTFNAFGDLEDQFWGEFEDEGESEEIWNWWWWDGGFNRESSSEYGPNHPGPVLFAVDRPDGDVVGDCTALPDDCTLAGAVEQIPSGGIITFDETVFPEDVPHEIQIQSPLELWQGGVTLRGRAFLEDGSGVTVAPAPVDTLAWTGLEVSSSNNYIEGMRFTGFSTGVWLSGDNNVLGRQPWTGDGNNETSDCGTGVAVEGDHNTIYGGHFDNNTVGILLDGAVGTAIQGAWSTLRCHDNTDVGILITAGSDQTRIDNGSIRGNGAHGIWVQDSSDVRVTWGVYVWDNGGDGIAVTGDSQNVLVTDVGTFGSNGGLAFNLVHEQDDEWGVTPNDGGDDDTGPNGLLNYPVIEQAYRLNANEIYVQGTACAGCRVVFRSADDDPSGHGEGQSKAATFYTDEGGFYEGTLSLGSQFHLITAMASTDVWTEEEWDAWWELNEGDPGADEEGGPPGSSSEFSPNVSVLSELVVDRADDTTYGQCDPLIPADCSLRGALAVASQGVTIYFDQQVFDADQETVIQLSQPLPPITTPNIQLLGTAHPDADWWQAVSVTLDGSQIPAGPTPANGLVLAGTGCTVNGLTIRGFKGDGILVLGANNILGDWPLGITLVQNEGYGARLSGASATGNQMGRAHVGVLDGADESGHGNGAGGVLIEGGASDNSIGSHTVKVSGNGGHGLSLVGNATRGNRVHTGDFGTPELGNEGHGIYVDGAKNSWLNPHGVSGNGGDGVHITGDSAGIQLDQVHGGLMDNGGLGINLVGGDTGDYGVTLNDTGDFDEGPNGLLNYPVVTAINDSGGGGGGVFFLEGTACTYCSVHIYQATDHPSGHGEAESLLGTAWSDDNGHWEHQIQPGFPFGLPLTDLTITTTATDCMEGEGCQHGPSTSELSPNVSVEDFVQICGDGDLDPGEACDDGNVNNGDGCSALCQEELCGDGIVQEGLGEQCDGENTPLCWWWDADGGPCESQLVCGDTCTCENGPPMDCDDGSPCTEDVCAEWQCVYEAVDCDDDDPCTEDTCSEASGGCEHTYQPGAPCEDGDLCTEFDFCGDNGVCEGGQLTQCDDDDVCTSDSCAPNKGCLHVANPCDDGNPCTSDGCDPQDGCFAVNLVLDDCDDGDACTEGEACWQGACQGGADISDTCDDGDVCTADSCDPATGCVFALGVVCDDEDPCTTDTCDPVQGCTYTQNTAPCDDGNPCTTGDLCDSGLCTSGAPTVCGDANPCTDDGCDPASGCTHTPNTAPCDDDDACTETDTCGGGACAGAPMSCDDDNACTEDTCDTAVGCQYADTSASCVDDNPCTDDSCVPATGCAFTPNAAPCDDSDLCTDDDVCGEGSCGGTPIVCDDGNPCTTDTCDPTSGCVYQVNTLPCDDSDACTVEDTCAAGTCVGQTKVCDDANPCTDDSCAPESGCVYVANALPCEDGEPCTDGDVCAGGACLSGDPTDCDDASVCTTELCEPGSGCVYTPAPGPCDDDDLCTLSDLCLSGACVGQPVVCDDGDACTTDACDPDSGECMSVGDPGICDDENPCTVDACDSADGCSYSDQEGPCDDQNACTVEDTCVQGECSSGPDLNCDDQDPCTVDACIPSAGCSYLPVTGVPECEEPGPDAGPSGSDAGPSGSDAGPSGSDAGPSGSDAGSSGSDAGSSGSDAGPSGSDAGPSGSDATGTAIDVPTTRGSVGANAVGPSETPSGGCMGCSGGHSDGGGGALIGLMTLALLFQRRRAGLSPS